MSGAKLPLRITIQYISFSAHVDFKQNSAFIEELGSPNLVLVHGDSNEMNRLRSALASRYAEKEIPLDIYTPRNCETVELYFRGEKLAKTVGSLATDVPKEESQVEGVLVSRDYAYTLMAPEDLPNFTDLVVTSLNQKQKVFCRAPIGLIKWHLENMYGTIKQIDEDSFRVFDTVTVSTSEDGNYLHLEWKGDAINDMIADSVLAVIIQSESSPASVKATKSSHSHHHHHEHTEEENERLPKDDAQRKIKKEVEVPVKEELPAAPYATFLEEDKWIGNVTKFLANHFGSEGVQYLGETQEADELQWEVKWDEFEAEIFCGKDGKGVRIVSSSQDTHKRISGIMSRVFKTMRPLEETWSLISS